jgi:hypothetical protein
MKDILAGVGILGCFGLLIFLVTTIQNVYFIKTDVKEMEKRISKLDDKVRDQEYKIKDQEYAIRRLER